MNLKTIYTHKEFFIPSVEKATAEYMKHYRQVIINIEVEDDLPEQKLEELVDKIKATVEENTDKKEIQLDGVRLN